MCFRIHPKLSRDMDFVCIDSGMDISKTLRKNDMQNPSTWLPKICLSGHSWLGENIVPKRCHGWISGYPFRNHILWWATTMMTRKSGSISICWISSALLTTELHPEDPLRTWLSRGLPPKKSSWVGFHICHFFLLGPSAWCWSIKTALLAVQNCFAQGVHHLIGVVLSPDRPLASPSEPSIFWWGWEPSQNLPSMAETISGTLVSMHVRFCIGVLVSLETKPSMHWSKVMSLTSFCSSKYSTSEGHGEDS